MDETLESLLVARFGMTHVSLILMRLECPGFDSRLNTGRAFYLLLWAICCLWTRGRTPDCGMSVRRVAGLSGAILFLPG